MDFETIAVEVDRGVAFAKLLAPPMNLLGPNLLRDMVALIQDVEGDPSLSVIVFKSADPDYFISHVDVTRIKEYSEHGIKLTGEPTLGLVFRYLSESRIVSIAQIEGRVRGAGSEFVLGCDMRFGARETAIFGQPEQAFGAIPGAGAVQHLTRLMGRGRALEALLAAQDFDADLAERYGWINRALPASELDAFVKSLALRIASFPASGHAIAKQRVNAIALAPPADFRRDAELFVGGLSTPEGQSRMRAAMARGFQTRDAELDLAGFLGHPR